MNYKSPIEIIVGQLRMEQEKNLEGDIFRAIQEYGITVDKEELIKALRYDRHQYEKGYKDGYDDGVADTVKKIKEKVYEVAQCLDEVDAFFLKEMIDQIAKEILEGENGT